MTVYAITDTKKGGQGLRLLIFKLPQYKSRVAASNSCHFARLINLPTSTLAPRLAMLLHDRYCQQSDNVQQVGNLPVGQDDSY